MLVLFPLCCGWRLVHNHSGGQRGLQSRYRGRGGSSGSREREGQRGGEPEVTFLVVFRRVTPRQEPPAPFPLRLLAVAPTHALQPLHQAFAGLKRRQRP